MKHFEGFLILVSYFTRIPIGRTIEYSDEKYERGIHMFPLLGVLIAMVMLFAAVFLSHFFGGMVRGALIFLVYVALTGAIHIDGFADSVDGFFSGRSRERTLEIMSDPHIGTFGVLGVALLSLVYSGIFADFSGHEAVFIMLFPYVGRTAAYFCASIFEYAKPSGMGKVFVDAASACIAALHIALLAVVGTVLSVVSGIKILQFAIPVAAAFAAAVASAWVSNRKIGGLTGDSMGMIIEFSQMVYLLTFVAAR